MAASAKVATEEQQQQRKLEGRVAGSDSSYPSFWIILATHIFGLIVPATYVWGAAAIQPFSDMLGKLEKDENQWVLAIFVTSIVVAAVGFFLYLPYILVIAPDLDKTTVARICLPALAFFIFSALWLPLCAYYLDEPSLGVFVSIWVDLIFVALSGLVWAVVVWILPAEQTQRVHRCVAFLGKVGLMYLAVHCTILDAVVWPLFFRRESLE
mmetsp:Transcript_10497/g.23849  ORF Transcript_10497/g.23849 Transcript_10497/m.23849 type:complete len:211 (-) Transcript_10497:258-890(-)|eukprot:CAMPEP_0178390384 /NCGR_PEP_ID=MMETSP0689_2-20121128/10620_1 /TAXON_ID=160604 /ORGANISM="Amphidinium massartii, Strain CS-259" /LENGTH=210 /DNA_ID=CAMNT_0020010895 /DNA_START=62 /DNA_END=694 /DNA_ORIENTATION=+